MTAGTRLNHWIAQELQPRLTLLEGRICRIEGPAHRRSEGRAVLAQIGVRILLQGPEQRGEIVVGHIGVSDEHRVFGAGSLAEHRYRSADRQQRVVPAGCAVVGDHDRLWR